MEIKLKNVKYKDNIKDLNIVFKENEITSIIGKNNSGKSDILNLIACFALPDDGEINIGRRKITKNIKKKSILEIKNKISYLKEDYQNQLFNINLLEDIKYVAGNKVKEDLLNDLMKLFGLDASILKKNYLEISNGEKKKIYLIQTILKDSKILILDNPNAGLDNKYKQNLVKILKKIKRDGKIIIIASKDSEFLLQISDRIVVFDDRKIILDEDKYKVMSNKQIMDKINMEIPGVISFADKVLKLKNIKLGYRDNINDLIKDIYRNAK